jgi:ABC-type lipoprotein export system ATPase subunit
MIRLVNLTKEYRVGEQIVVTPVRHVSLTVARGDLIIIVGRSGSGKTTLLNLAAGLVKPTSGEVFIGDVNVRNMNDKQLSLLRNRKIGFVFQYPSLLSSLNALENVALPASFGPGQRRRNANARASELLELMGLSERLESYPRQLSAGEQKRVVIARSLMNAPEVVLADEPTSDLDEQTEQEIMTLMRQIHAEGVTIMIVTHSLELMRYATRALRMEDGVLTDITGMAGASAVKAKIADSGIGCADAGLY